MIVCFLPSVNHICYGEHARVVQTFKQHGVGPEFSFAVNNEILEGR